MKPSAALRPLASLIALVACGELLLRVFYAEPLKDLTYPLIYRPDAFVGYRYRPNSTGVLRVPSIERKISINAQGFLGANFSPEKPVGVQRIAVVDSSWGTGMWLAEGEPYAKRLETLLLDAGYPVEVLNFSIDGKGRDFSMLRLIEREVLRYSPDLVLLSVRVPFVPTVAFRETYKGKVITFGDSSQSAATHRANRNKLHRTIDETMTNRWTVLYDLSYLVRALVQFYLHHSGVGSNMHNPIVAHVRPHLSYTPAFPPLSIESAVARIAKTRNRVTRAGSHLFAFQLAASESEAQHSAFEAGGVELTWIPLSDDPSLRHRYDGHPNAKGQKLIAEGLRDALVASGQLRPR